MVMKSGLGIRSIFLSCASLSLYGCLLAVYPETFDASDFQEFQVRIESDPPCLDSLPTSSTSVCEATIRDITESCGWRDEKRRRTLGVREGHLLRMALPRVFGADWARTFQRRTTGFCVVSVLCSCIAPAQPDAILFLAFLGRYFSCPPWLGVQRSQGGLCHDYRSHTS